MTKISQIALSPFAALRKATVAVPQLKYAMAIIGVAAVVAIVLSWIADPRIAIFGILITIALMYILAIFAQSVGSLPGLRWLTGFIAWSVAIVFVSALMLLVTSYSLGKPQKLSDRLFASDTQLLVPAPTSETATLSGTVIDQNEKPIQNARVTLDDFPQRSFVETSSDGIFVIEAIPKKYGERVLLRIVLDGYQPNPYTEDVVLGAEPPRVKLRKTR